MLSLDSSDSFSAPMFSAEAGVVVECVGVPCCCGFSFWSRSTSLTEQTVVWCSAKLPDDGQGLISTAPELPLKDGASRLQARIAPPLYVCTSEIDFM